MLREPKKRKFRKARKGRIQRKVSPDLAQRGTSALQLNLKYGDHALVSLASARWTARQIEAGRRTITASLKRAGRLWIRAFPDTPVTAKPTDARMGKGKGNVSYWIAPIKPGQPLFELAGVDKDRAIKALGAAAKKMPFPTSISSRYPLKNLNIINNYASNGLSYFPTSSLLAFGSLFNFLFDCSS